MKIGIYGRPEFELPVTLEQVELCLELSRTHYDGVCRSASLSFDDVKGTGRPQGFLAGWKNVLQNAQKFSPSEPILPQRASWRELDTLAKILENVHACSNDGQRHVVWTLAFAIRGAMTAANEVSQSWQAEFTHSPRT